MSLASTGTFASLTSTLMMLGSPRCAAWWCWVGGGERREGLAKRVGCGCLGWFAAAVFGGCVVGVCVPCEGACGRWRLRGRRRNRRSSP